MNIVKLSKRRTAYNSLVVIKRTQQIKVNTSFSYVCKADCNSTVRYIGKFTIRHIVEVCRLLFHTVILKGQKLVMPHITLYPIYQKNEEHVDPSSHLSAAEAHHTPAMIHYGIRYIRISACIAITFVTYRCFVANLPSRYCTITVCNCCLTIRLRHHHCCTVQTVSLIMTALHVATPCSPAVCLCLLQTSFSTRKTVDCRLLCTPRVPFSLHYMTIPQKHFTTHVMLFQSENHGS